MSVSEVVEPIKNFYNQHVVPFAVDGTPLWVGRGEAELNQEEREARAKYPDELTSPGPFEKWVMFSAMSGRHIGRVGLSEQFTPDRKIASVQLYIPEDALRSEQTANYNSDAIGAFMGALSEFTAQSGGDFISNMAKSSRELVDASIAAAQGGAAGTSRIDALKEAATGLGATALKSVVDLSADLVKGFGDDAAGITEQVLFAKFLNMASTRFPGATEQVTGLRVNPRTDVLFDHVQYREHTFEYMLIPRSLKEAKSIDKIIHMFQFYMLPSYSPNMGGKGNIAGTMIGFPYEFEISFWNEDKPAWHHINKIGRSVLTSVAVDHAGAGSVSFYKGENNDPTGPPEVYPVATKLSLRFQEVRLLARDSIEINRGGLEPPPVGSELDPKGSPFFGVPGKSKEPVDAAQTQGADTEPPDHGPPADAVGDAEDTPNTPDALRPDGTIIPRGSLGGIAPDGTRPQIGAAPETSLWDSIAFWR